MTFSRRSYYQMKVFSFNSYFKFCYIQFSKKYNNETTVQEHEGNIKKTQIHTIRN